MEEERQNVKEELTPKEMKGLDMVVKGATKKYPFIRGWELHPDYRTYDSVLFIVLLINPFMFSQWYGCDMKETWKRMLNNDEYYTDFKYYSLGSFLVDDCYDNDELYQIKKDMSDKINDLYQLLPEQYSSTYIFTPSFNGSEPTVFRHVIIASDYIVSLT